MGIRIVLLIFISCVICSCDRTIPPKKLDSLPKESFWKGGIDRGHWFNVNNYNDSIVNISIFHEHNGALWQTDNYKLCEECSSIKIDFKDLEKEILLFDGTHIVLKSVDSVNHRYCYLKEVGKAKEEK